MLPNSKVDYATPADAKQMLELNRKIYPPEWHAPDDYVANVLNKNPWVSRVLKVSGEVKGIYSILPLEKEIYKGVLDGRIDESDLHKYVQDYKTPKSVYLYFISMIVDIHDNDDNDYKNYTRELIRDIPINFKNILRTSPPKS